MTLMSAGRRIGMLGLALVFGLALAACGKEEESAGDKMEDAAHKAGEAAEQMGDKAGQMMDEAGKKAGEMMDESTGGNSEDSSGGESGGE